MSERGRKEPTQRKRQGIVPPRAPKKGSTMTRREELIEIIRRLPGNVKFSDSGDGHFGLLIDGEVWVTAFTSWMIGSDECGKRVFEAAAAARELVEMEG